MEMTLNNGFCEMSQDEAMLVDGGFVITSTLTIFVTGAALAKGVALIGGAYMAGYTLGSHIKAAQGR